MPKRKKNKQGALVKPTVTEEGEERQALPGDDEDEDGGTWLHPSETKKTKVERDEEANIEKLKKKRRKKNPSIVQDEEKAINVEEEVAESKKNGKKKKNSSSVIDGEEMMMDIEDGDTEPAEKNKESESRNSVCVGDLRDEYESNAEWEIRSQFLDENLDSLPLDRLISLSKCFVYNEIYGCVYPTQVMNLVKRLRKPLVGLIAEPMDRLKTKFAISFVKPSETSSRNADKNTSEKKGMISFVKAGENYGSLNFSKDGGENLNFSKEEEKKKNFAKEGGKNCNSMDFSEEGGEKEEEKKQCVKNSDPKEERQLNVKSLDQNEEDMDSLFNNMQAQSVIKELEKKFAEICENIDKLSTKHSSDPISLLNESALKCKLVPSSENEFVANGRKCRVFLNGVLVGTGEGRNKKLARSIGHSCAISALTKQYKKFEGEHPEKITFVSSDEPFEKEEVKFKNSRKEITSYSTKPVQSNSKPSMELLTRLKKNLPNFYLFENRYLTDEVGAKSILHWSFNFHQPNVKPETKTEMIGCQEFSCQLCLDGEVLSEARGETKSSAELEAARLALEIMKDVFWTMLCKGRVDSNEDQISKDEVVKGRVDKTSSDGVVGAGPNDKLSESNLGFKLMQKMGWSGKGIGKNEQGREEPVLVNQLVRREGLGNGATAGKNFRASVRKVIEDYIRSDRDDDLAFAPDFSKEERKQIHMICSATGLKSKSYGRDPERYTVISRQRNKDELFQYVMAKGGETNKYKLIPPRLECFR